MKYQLTGLLIFIILCGCQVNNPKTKAEWWLEGDSIISQPKEGKHQVVYKFNLDCTRNKLKSITVISNTIVQQEIIANKDIMSKSFSLIDWNFDGHKDITVLSNSGSMGASYWIWNYSPTKKEYYYNDQLSDRPGLEIDTLSKLIVFHIRTGAETESWDSLQYNGNQLKFIKGCYQERWNDSSGKMWIKKTFTKIINGKRIVFTDSSIVE